MGKGESSCWCIILWWLWGLELVDSRWLLSVNQTFVVSQDIRQPVVLQAMLNTSVSTLVFEIPQFVLVPEAWRFITKETPYMLDRPFTITSQGPSAPTLVDFQFLSQRVVLRSNITFSFNNVNLANIRMSNGLGTEWFMLSEGATVIFSDVVIVDVVCYDTPDVALKAAQSSPQLPGQAPNRVSISNSTCLFFQGQQRCFQDGVHYESFTVVTTYYDAAQSISKPGYTLVYDNVTHVCQSYLDQQCVQQQKANICWEQQAQQLLPGVFGVPAATSPAGLSAGGIAGIAIAGGIALLVGALVLVYMRRRRAIKTTDPVLKQLHDESAKGSSGTNPPPDVFGSKLSARGTTESMASGSLPSNSTAGIRLGVLLGAGSFGRVYKARWHSSDVAVKVMTCRPSELVNVMKEAELMMSMQHVNIVRALNCTVVDRKAVQVHNQAFSAASQNGSNGSRPASELVSPVHPTADKQLATSFRTASNEVPTASSTRSRTAQGTYSAAPVGAGSSGSVNTNIGSKPGQHRSADGKCHILQQPSRRVPFEADSGARGSVSTSDQAMGSAGWDRHNDGSLSSLDGPVVPYTTDSLTGTSVLGGEIKEADAVEVWLVMELCTGGTLKDACNAPQDKMDMAQLVTRLLEVATGMSYLHAHNVLHSDLKAANILLKNTVQGSYGQVAKISDFGLSSQMLAGATHRSTRTTGTITHTAPEVLQTAKIAPAADVYAFGIMMWELFTNKSAFQGAPYGTVALSVVRGERPPIPASMPDSYHLLMCSCWAQNPLDRPDFDQVGKCLLLMLDSLETMDSPLTDPTYLAAIGHGGECRKDDAITVQQEQEPEAQHQADQAASQRTKTVSGSVDWDDIPATPGRNSREAQQRQQQQSGVAQNYVVRGLTSVSSGRPSDSAVSSRHIKDL